MAMTCPKCGAENTEEARFCRICGVQIGPESFHEAPTRNFDQRRDQAPAPEVSPYATYGPEGSAILPPRDPRMYVPPSVVQPPGGAMMGYQQGTGFAGPIPTNPLQTGPVKKSYLGRVLLIVGGLFVFVLVALIGLGLLIADEVKVNQGAADRSVELGEPGAGGPRGSVREKVNPDSLSGPIAGWYYDGADIDSLVDGSAFGVSGTVLEMTSEDDVDSIADFYRERLADARDKREIREDGQVVFMSDGAVVTVEPSDEEDGLTSITVMLGNLAGMPGGVPGPGFNPGVPVPPAPVVVPPATPAPGAPAAAPPAPTTTPEKTPAKGEGKGKSDVKPTPAPPTKP